MLRAMPLRQRRYRRVIRNFDIQRSIYKLKNPPLKQCQQVVKVVLMTTRSEAFLSRLFEFNAHFCKMTPNRFWADLGKEEDQVSRSPNRRVSLPTKTYSSTDSPPNVSMAANIRSVLARPLASNIKYPSPLEDPTHSPITAPIGA